MRRSVGRTTRFKLALIGIPLLECLVLLCLTGLILFGGRIFSRKTREPETDAATSLSALEENIVEIKAKASKKEALRVSLTTDGVLRYSPIHAELTAVSATAGEQAAASVSRNLARNVRRPDMAALADFSNGTLPILQRNEEAVTLAKLLYGEARGIDSEAEKAAVVWCVLNRVDDPRFPDTVEEVVTQSSQFDGYAAEHPVQSNLYLLAMDVLSRWNQGKITGAAAGRVLPEGYCYFTGDGKHNFFAEDMRFEEIWGWGYPDPYPAIRAERLRNYYPTSQEVKMIANVIYGVSQGNNVAEHEAVVWCVLNRVASGLFPDTVYEVITEKKQFPAYREDNLLLEENVELVREVASRWYQEMNGAEKEEVGRILPKSYLYFDGNGRRNFFSKKYPVRYGYVFISGRGYLKARW